MTAMRAPAGAPVSAVPAGHGGELVGLWPLIRLNIRRERIPLLVWTLGLSAVAASTFSAIASLYPQGAERAALAASITTNPAFLAMLGPVGSTSIGGLSAWRIGVLASTMIGLMAIFTVVRRSRADEEAGRTELLMAGVVGRSAQLVAALLTAGAAALIIGLAVAAAGIAQGLPTTGSLALGAAFTGCGWVFAGVAAITAQLAESARTATAIAGAALGAGYAIRAVGDTVDGMGWLQWLSPQGWVTRVDAYAGDQFAVLGLFLLASLAEVAVALILLHRRDVGLALYPARLGPAGNPRLSSAGALAGRLHRGSLIGWGVGFVAFGAITGGIAASARDLTTSSPQLADIIARLGGAGVLIDTFLAALGAYAGLLAGAYVISAGAESAHGGNRRESGPGAGHCGGTRPLAQRPPGVRVGRSCCAAGLVWSGHWTPARRPGGRPDRWPRQGVGHHAHPDPSGARHGRGGGGTLRVGTSAGRGGVGGARPCLGVRVARPVAAAARGAAGRVAVHPHARPPDR
ncbi:MAG TPA: hypothetical protein VIJ00_11390 [Nakamurella sp.]